MKGRSLLQRTSIQPAGAESAMLAGGASRLRRFRERRRLRAAITSLRAVGDRSATRGADVDRVLDMRRELFHTGRLLPDRGTSPNERLAGSDRQLLAACTRDLLSLDPAGFTTHIGSLVENLDSRTSEFGTEFSYERLSGWCTVLNDACGALHLANRHLLYRLGVVVEASVARDLARLVQAGVAELDRRFDRKICGCGDWLAVADADDARERHQLANAVSYLSRDAYSVGSPDSLDALTDVLSRSHLDLLVQIPGFGMIPFTNSDDRFYSAILAAIRSVEDCLMSVPDSVGTDDPFDSSRKVVAAEFVRARAILGTAGTASDVRKPGRNDSRPPGAEHHQSPLDRCRALRRTGRIDEARTQLELAGPVSAMSLEQLHEYMASATILTPRHEFDDAVFAVRDRLRELAEEQLGTVRFMARALRFQDLATDHITLENSNHAFDRFTTLSPSSKSSERSAPVVVLAIDQCRVTAGLLAPLAVVLREHGVRFYNLQENRLVNDAVEPWPHSPRLTADSSALVGEPCDPDELMAEWTVDLAGGILVTDGVNYFQGLYERVGRVLKVYDIDWNLPSVKTYARQWIRQVDRVVTCLNLVRHVAEQKSMRVRFVTVQSHFTPWSVYRVYAAANPDHIEHVTISSSYENWTTNMSGEPLSTLALLNNTRHHAPSLPAFGTAEQFRRFLDTEHATRRVDLVRRVDQLTRMERAGTPTALTHDYIDKMRADRRNGKSVFCLLGKIPYDLAVPYQGGPAHASMGDWLNHTVSTIGGTDRSVLYVKPHPHELNVSIAARPMQTFVDMILEPDTDHVTVLPHEGVSLQHLLAVVDVFLVWNGSSIAELGAQGACVVACDDWAALNYPIDVFLPDDRPHYEAILTGRCAVEMSPGFEDLSKAYIAFLTSAPFALDYSMVHRSSTNTLFNSSLVRFAEFTTEAVDALHAQRAAILDAFGFRDPA